MRLFVALDIPDDVRTTLAALAAKLRAVSPKARWARIEGLHVTLKFIGEASQEKAQAIKSALVSLPARNTFAMNFGSLGFFPNERRPRVLWAGVAACPELAALAADVETALAALDLPRDDPAASAFRPGGGKGRVPHPSRLLRRACPESDRRVGPADQTAKAPPFQKPEGWGTRKPGLSESQNSLAFSPHLTLARFDSPRGLDALHAAIEKAGPLEFGAATAREFHLYQSVLKPGGAEYTRLATFPFAGRTSE
ncbi:MAG TPA: RNA 2',3'-cyclic phosphodiesterase [Verrucomicrobiae bacterium]|jgi:2'-5' RNA ligase|nr:RNA 2',3'-cyclic phosphodiesterase [Verrucomicrobiae bacterium]